MDTCKSCYHSNRKQKSSSVWQHSKRSFFKDINRIERNTNRFSWPTKWQRSNHTMLNIQTIFERLRKEFLQLSSSRNQWRCYWYQCITQRRKRSNDQRNSRIGCTQQSNRILEEHQETQDVVCRWMDMMCPKYQPAFSKHCKWYKVIGW